jgi:hypothetical protein
MKRILPELRFLTLLWTAVLIISATTATAADFALDPVDPNNGLFEIYSATFDPALDPNCTGAADPAECAFFGGKTPNTRAIVVTPTPTGVETVADTTLCKQDFIAPKDVPPCPLGTLYPTATPSALNLTLSAGDTQLAINGGNVFFPNLVLVINPGETTETNVFAEGASMVSFAPSPGTMPVDANGVAVFEIELAPATAVDFATFTEIVTSCTGPLCSLIGILTLDMVRYRLTIDWDPTFSFFTADFAGQTGNNSIVFATLDSVVPVPEITVTDSVLPADDQNVPFGDVTVAAQSPIETITVTNSGTADLVINGPVTLPVAPFTVLNNACTTNLILAPVEFCTVTVRFDPTAAVTSSDTVVIPSNDPNNATVTVNLSGTGVLQEITVTDTALPADDQNVSFGDVTVAAQSPVETITVTNSGTADLVINGPVTLPVAPFTVLNNTCTTNLVLAPVEFCTVTVRFDPTAAVPSSDTVVIPSNDPNNATVTVNLNGTGTLALVAKISVTDSVPPADDQNVPFGDVTVAAQSSVEIITVTSSGTADLIINGQVTLPAAPFIVLNNTCTTNLVIPPAAICTMTVRFDPTVIGLSSDTIDIPSNDLSNAIATVSLSGTGALPAITVTDSVLPIDDLHIPFGNVIETMAAIETVTVTNNSTVDLTLGAVTMADPSGPFSILTNNCAPPQNIITPGTDCTIDVRFLPGTVGPFTNNLNIPSDDPNMPTSTVIVDGTGAPSPAPDITVTDPVPPDDDLMMPFGDVTEATAWDRAITITNNGNANLQIGMIAQSENLAEPFSILDDTCSGQIIAPAPPPDTDTPTPDCTVTVRFLPSTVDSFNDSFDIPSDDPDEPVLIFSVSGDGVVLGTGTISLRPSGADSGLFGTATGPGALLALFILVAANLRRRRCRQG